MERKVNNWIDYHNMVDEEMYGKSTVKSDDTYICKLENAWEELREWVTDKKGKGFCIMIPAYRILEKMDELEKEL